MSDKVSSTVSSNVSANPPNTGWKGLPQFDVSPEDKDRILRRKQIRENLKSEFNRLYYNPYKLVSHVEILDPAVNHYMSMRASFYEHWRPSWRNFSVFALIMSPILIYGHYTATKRNRFDKKCRSGELPYERRGNIVC